MRTLSLFLVAGAIALSLGTDRAWSQEMPGAEPPAASKGAPSAPESEGPPNSSNPGAQEAFEAGQAAHQAADFDGALAAYKKACELDPKFSRPLYETSLIYVEQDEYGPAADTMRKAIKISPKEPSYHYALARIMLKKGDPNEAIREIKETLKLAPNQAGPWWTLAQIYDSKQDKKRAIEGYRNYVRLAPNGPFAGEATHRMYVLKSADDYEENQRRTGQ